jgi:hypothetical protein
MTDAEQERAFLLKALHQDEQIILVRWADLWLFPEHETTLAKWCTDNGVKCRSYWMGELQFYSFQYEEEDDF